MRKVDLVLTASESLLPGKFVVHRALPRRELRRVGGFVFLDHFDQTGVTPELFDVPPHPHVGLQTVTYLFDGEILHTDSLDYQQPILPGDVNWMTSGRGITHSEQVTRLLPRIHGVQSWVGLPQDERKTEPAFDHYPKTTLPKIFGDGVEITVIAGECLGRASSVETYQELVYLDVAALPGAAFEFPTNPRHELAVYICDGEILIGDVQLRPHDLGRLSADSHLAFSAVSEARFIVLGGEPLPDPTVIYWNFVTDTLDEAKQRMIEWGKGKFPAVGKYTKVSTAPPDRLPERMKLL